MTDEAFSVTLRERFRVACAFAFHEKPRFNLSSTIVVAAALTAQLPMPWVEPKRRVHLSTACLRWVKHDVGPPAGGAKPSPLRMSSGRSIMRRTVKPDVTTASNISVEMLLTHNALQIGSAVRDAFQP